MPLIACYECGKQVSSLAKTCPVCGAPPRPSTAMPPPAPKRGDNPSTPPPLRTKIPQGIPKSAYGPKVVAAAVLFILLFLTLAVAIYEWPPDTAGTQSKPHLAGAGQSPSQPSFSVAPTGTALISAAKQNAAPSPATAMVDTRDHRAGYAVGQELGYNHAGGAGMPLPGVLPLIANSQWESKRPAFDERTWKAGVINGFEDGFNKRKRGQPLSAVIPPSPSATESSPAEPDSTIPRAVSVDSIVDNAKSKMTWKSTAEELKKAKSELLTIPAGHRRYVKFNRCFRGSMSTSRPRRKRRSAPRKTLGRGKVALQRGARTDGTRRHQTCFSPFAQRSFVSFPVQRQPAGKADVAHRSKIRKGRDTADSARTVSLQCWERLHRRCAV